MHFPDLVIGTGYDEICISEQALGCSYNFSLMVCYHIVREACVVYELPCSPFYACHSYGVLFRAWLGRSYIDLPEQFTSVLVFLVGYFAHIRLPVWINRCGKAVTSVFFRTAFSCTFTYVCHNCLV